MFSLTDVFYFFCNIKILAATIIFIFAFYLYFKAEKRVYPFEGLYGVVIPESKLNFKTNNKKIYKSQEKCRDIFQGLFGLPFISVRPPFLKNPITGKNLELDGYNPNIMTPIGKGLAFEYDGEQHSRFNPYFHRNGENEFVYQTKKDHFKDLKCKENGVLLIRIPHFVVRTDLERYIKDTLRKKGMRV